MSTAALVAVPVTTPVIAPLVARHAGDAAFYWQQHDQSAYSGIVGLSQLQEIDRLLDGHLDGLRVAGEAGWEIAFDKLTRWRGPQEAFVCSVLALELTERGHNSRMAQTLDVIATEPARMLRGLISALAWSANRDVWQKFWVTLTQQPMLAVAAWRSLALMDGTIGTEFVNALPQALQSDSPEVRAAACRMQAQVKPAWLEQMLKDPVREVRAEAAIGMANRWHQLTGEQKNAAANALWQASYALMQELPQIEGIARTRADHRLARWMRYVALTANQGFEGIPKFISALPPRIGLWFVLHHCDAHYLPWVVQQMNNPDVARLAGWVWASITGIDLHSQGLALPPRGPQDVHRRTDSDDPGLVEPNQERITPIAINMAIHTPCLLGKPLDNTNLSYTLWKTPQALRWIAAKRLMMQGLPSLNIRSHALLQLSS